MANVAEQLSETLQPINDDYYASIDCSTPKNDFWFKSQIIAIARQLQYYADTGTYRAWIRLKIWETRQVDLVVSFHSLGYNFSGVLAVSAFIEYRQHNEGGDISVEGPYKLSDEVLQFAYTESEEKVIERFSLWSTLSFSPD